MLRSKWKLVLVLVISLICNTLAVFNLTTAQAAEALQPSYKIYGYISSATEGSKSGFAVTLQGTDKTATTDSDGYFYITGINTAATNLSLKISKAQYLSRTIQIGNISDSLQIGTPEAPINMWAGDLNQDGAINMADIIEITKSINSTSGDGRYVSLHDINKDNKVNMSDISIVAGHFNTTNANYTAISPVPIRHSFIAVDEARSQLHFVDQNDHSKDWNITLPYRCRDYQLIGNQQLLLSGGDGYYIYDLTTRKMIKEFHNSSYSNTQTVRRTTDGHTFIGRTNSSNNGFIITELDASDKAVKTATFSGLSDLRLMRFSSRNTLLFGGANTAIEADMTGKIYRKLSIPNTSNVYQILDRPNGELLISCGYSVNAAIYDKNGNLVKKFGGNPAPESNLNYNFFGGIQVLKNGNIVISNWTGHNSGDSSKGVQFLEFTPKGDLVWSWHDAALTGSVHGVIVMDGVDASKYYDDRTGVLQQVN
ncbi:MAG TPA: dockerin type I domain-containing protein [Clostridia bacterium]|nr:dockerin type I domain-containing protein [Clostridia bacterium]